MPRTVIWLSILGLLTACGEASTGDSADGGSVGADDAQVSSSDSEQALDALDLAADTSPDASTGPEVMVEDVTPVPVEDTSSPEDAAEEVVEEGPDLTEAMFDPDRLLDVVVTLSLIHI